MKGSEIFQASLVPEPLKPGDLIGVAAPSSPVDPEFLNRGIEALQARGFRVVVGCSVGRRRGYLAGSDVERIKDLNTMLGSPEIRGIAFARGGYGSMRLLEAIDVDAVRRDPKILVGMSDVTALQLSLFARTGLVTISGPMVAGQIARGLDNQSDRALIQALQRPTPRLSLLTEATPGVKALKGGTADGVLLGGCLSIVAALQGAVHTPNLRGALLFLEDVNEPPYRIDRMLTQLKLAGALDDLAGLILGRFLGPDGSSLSKEVDDIVVELTEEFSYPIVSGFPHGHALPNVSIPHGASALLTTAPISLEVTWGNGSRVRREPNIG